jgi:hypothetical protein
MRGSAPAAAPASIVATYERGSIKRTDPLLGTDNQFLKMMKIY